MERPTRKDNAKFKSCRWSCVAWPMQSSSSAIQFGSVVSMWPAIVLCRLLTHEHTDAHRHQENSALLFSRSPLVPIPPAPLVRLPLLRLRLRLRHHLCLLLSFRLELLQQRRGRESSHSPAQNYSTRNSSQASGRIPLDRRGLLAEAWARFALRFLSKWSKHDATKSRQRTKGALKNCPRLLPEQLKH